MSDTFDEFDDDLHPQADAEALGVRLTEQFPNGDTGVFRVLCQLGHGEAFAT